MMIPMVDLKLQYQHLKNEIEPVVLKALSDAHYILGPNVSAFEKEAADYLGVRYALGVASGSEALHLALLALGVGPGDEVITPSFTFIATVTAILHVGATPVFIDVDEYFNFDVKKLESLITPKTKALMPVHLYGQPVNMVEVMRIAEQHKLVVVEDCAQSFGAHWNKKMTGSFGDCSIFSFYPSKNLSCFGDGGLVVTHSEEVYRQVLALRSHGSYVRYHHEKLGFASRLDELQAAILRVKLKHLPQFNERRREMACYYSQCLDGLVETPKAQAGAHHIFHQYTILHPERDKIHAALTAASISSAIYYPIPIHRQEVFQHRYDHLHLPMTESLTEHCLSLPIYPELTKAQVDSIVKVIRDVVA